ncbi:hypothetical protein EK21DRAFT_116298 [Setomelanomma holmii]|uniref:Uncharacterized protein n=1 Tax=Setomelanomma holmii TaxID=210430 RepID=A0A9P4LJC1_9PLEO|nr:hypothetical protein EK21DRAFT_116298 [Setomelanomma holmii]
MSMILFELGACDGIKHLVYGTVHKVGLFVPLHLSLFVGPGRLSPSQSKSLFWLSEILDLFEGAVNEDLDRSNHVAAGIFGPVSIRCLAIWQKDLYSANTHRDESARFIAYKPKFRAFYRRTMTQLRNNPTIVVRLLLDLTSTLYKPIDNLANCMDDLNKALERHYEMQAQSEVQVELRFVFVVPARLIQSCRQFMAEPGRLPFWLTEAMWSLQAARGGLDPMLD